MKNFESKMDVLVNIAESLSIIARSCDYIYKKNSDMDHALNVKKFVDDELEKIRNRETSKKH